MDFQTLNRTVLIVVAHPDDEAVAFGGLLQRASRTVVAFATDGAPRHHFFWRSYASREAYAQTRRQECLTALGVVKAEPLFLGDRLSDSIADQELFGNLATVASALQHAIREIKPDCLLTLAYEGGHPDHDACCFLTCCAGRQMRIPVWESPLYHRREDGSMATQVFAQFTGEESILKVEGELLNRKLMMLQSYKSQRQVLAGFEPDQEIFRPVANYDFSRPPLPRKLNYESWGFPMSGEEVSREFASCMNSELNSGQPQANRGLRERA